MSSFDDPATTPVLPRRHFPIWGWLSIGTLIIAVACVVWFVVVPWINTSTSQPVTPDSRSAPVWGPVVDVTQGLQPAQPGQYYFVDYTLVSGDLILASISLSDLRAGTGTIGLYLRAIDAQASKIIWTLDMASIGVPPKSNYQLDMDSSSGMAILIWVTGDLCYLISIRISDGTVMARSSTGLPCPEPFSPGYQFFTINAVDGTAMVSILMAAAESDPTKYAYYGFEESDLDHPVWQHRASSFAYVVGDRWVCADGCWSLADGSDASFGADARSAPDGSGVRYFSFQDVNGKFRIYRFTNSSSSFNFQQWSTSNDKPMPGTKAVTWSSAQWSYLNSSLKWMYTPPNGNAHTLLLCEASACTPVSMDGNVTYPSFPFDGYPSGIEFNETLLVSGYDSNGRTNSQLVSLSSGQMTEIGPYDGCVAPNDLAYCRFGKNGSPVPMKFQAIDPAKGAVPVWSSQPDQMPDSDGYHAQIGETASTLFCYDYVLYRFQFASRY